MKKLSIITFITCALISAACENTDTINDTRVPDVVVPTISLNSIAVNKYDATFTVSLDEAGNPEAREYGILISQEPQPTPDNSIILVAASGENSATLTGSFSPGTVYYACAYALTANRMSTSDIKQFETDAHKLGAFLGNKTLSGYNLHSGSMSSVSVTITPDDNDENIAYLGGLSSNAGVQLQLGTVKLVFDLEAGTVTIPEEQVITETKYGNYRYMALDEKGDPVTGNIVGTIDGNAIHLSALGALIIIGANEGLAHWAFLDINIQ